MRKPGENYRRDDDTTVPEHFICQEDLDNLKSSRVNNTTLLPELLSGKSTRNRILWLLGSGNNSKRKSYITQQVRRIAPHLINHILFVEVNSPNAKLLRLKKGTKATYEVVPEYENIIHHNLRAAFSTARLVVINDFSALAATLASTTGHGNKKTLSVFRGSTYVNSLWRGLPAYVIEDASKNYGWQPDSQGKDENNQIQNIQFFEYDIYRIEALYNNPSIATDNFDERFTVVHSAYQLKSQPANSVSNCSPSDYHNNSRDYLNWLSQQSLIALDYETARGHQTLLTVTGITNNDISTIKTWAIPQANTHPTCANNCHMTPIEYRKLAQATLEHDCPKIWHNGNYDLQQALAYSAGLNSAALDKNIHHDTMLLWHAFRAQMPQSLAAVASVFIPTYYYWKDEIKGASDSKAREKTGSPVPLDRKGYLTYIRYGGLDTHNTMLAFYHMVVTHNLLSHPQTKANYLRELTLLRGPLINTNMLGAELDRAKLLSYVSSWSDEAEAAAQQLAIASNNNINPEKVTSTDIGYWLYNILGAKPDPKDQKRIDRVLKSRKANSTARLPRPSTDAKVLRLVTEQHPIYEAVYDLTQAHAKPAKLRDLYGNLEYPSNNGRHRIRTNYSFRPYTGRLSSTGSAFWDGTNVQNIPGKVRDFITASPGCVLIDIDYSSADSYHFAVACQDKNMIRNIFSADDTHSRHVEMIFRMPYEEVIAGKKAQNPIIVDPVIGLRQIIKKLCHGGNYGMLGPTAYANAGREALLAAAKLLNISTSGWTRDHFYKFIEYLLKPYFEGYSDMLPWRKEIVADCISNRGWVTCQGGHSCYFPEWQHPREHQKLMRALLAFYGQGGTGSMVNQAMHRLFYGSFDEASGQVVYHPSLPSICQQYSTRIVFQTHDSFTFELPIAKITPHAINALLTAMELPCYFNGMEYVVPCEAEIGFRWGKSMSEISRDSTQSDLTFAALDQYMTTHPKLLEPTSA